MNLPEKFDFSQSNLKDYLDCPYRFYLRYILHTKWPALLVDDALEFEMRGKTGARFHRLIQQYLIGLPEARLDEIAQADPNPMFIQWWESFLETIPPYLSGQKYVEMTLRTKLGGHNLVAKYDLIMVQDENLVIFDWKTSQKQPRKAWLLDRIQTRLYRLILTQAANSFSPSESITPEKVTMNYWFATYPDSPVSLPYSNNVYQEDKVFFREIIQEISDRKEDHFYRTEDIKKCHYCVYRSHCDRGIAAGDLGSFETFEMNEEDFELDLDFDDIQEVEF
jgi:hypothetical protein